MNMAAETFRVLNENTFQIHLTDYEFEDEDGGDSKFIDVDITIVFSEKTANVLTAL